VPEGVGIQKVVFCIAAHDLGEGYLPESHFEADGMHSPHQRNYEFYAGECYMLQTLRQLFGRSPTADNSRVL